MAEIQVSKFSFDNAKKKKVGGGGKTKTNPTPNPKTIVLVSVNGEIILVVPKNKAINHNGDNNDKSVLVLHST